MTTAPAGTVRASTVNAVEAGSLTLTVSGERHTVDAGQCARFPASRPHRYGNEGTEPVRFTMVVVIPPTQG